MNQNCVGCGVFKTEDNTATRVHPSGTQRFHSRCTGCVLDYRKAYYKSNKEKRKSYRKDYYRDHKSEIRRKKKLHYKQHREEILAQNKLYRESHLGEIQAQKKMHRMSNRKEYREKSKIYSESHKRERSDRERKRRGEDLNYKLTCILRSRLSHALRGELKITTTLELLGCTPSQFWEHLESQFQPGMTRANHGEWHVDHIIPIKSFNLADPKQQEECFHFTNFQPFWAFDNMSKGAKISGKKVVDTEM